LQPSSADDAGRAKWGWMWDSSTFHAILEEGREEGREEVRIQRRILEWRYGILNVGTEKFGPADASTVEVLERIDDLDVLRRLLRGILRASTWQELLATVLER
jgi:hypothetical protein